MNSEQPAVAQIHDKSQKPTGLFRNPRTQQWVYIGVSAAVIIPILFSGSGNKPRAVTAASTSSPQPTPPQIIQDYQHDLDRQKQALEQQKKEYETAKRQLVEESPTAGSPAAPMTVYRSLPTMPTQSMAGELRDRTLFASNVVDLRPAGSEVSDQNPRALASRDLRSEDEATETPRGRDARLIKARPAYEERNQAEGKNYVLFEGTILETVLKNRLDGYFSGPVSCMVTTDVYSHDRSHLLIPKGTEVLGEVQKVDNFGQQRLAVFFHRLIMPDGYSISLDQFKGLDQIGETGLRDLVNHHFMQIFGTSLAIGAVSGFAQANTRYGLDASGLDIYRQGVSASLSQSATHILDRFLNVLPTITIREGQRIKIYLAGDLLLPDYDHHTMPEDL